MLGGEGGQHRTLQVALMRALRQRAAVSTSPAGIADTDAVVAVALAVAVGRAGELGSQGFGSHGQDGDEPREPR